MTTLGRILIYGATGYTAGLIVQAMLEDGLRPILSARRRPELESLAGRFGLESRVASLDDPENIGRALAGIEVVLNAAGPFRNTVDPLVRACLNARVHYLDVSGEVDAIEAAARYHQLARRQGLTLLCGAGFDVVPSDCLCAHVGRRANRACALRLAISGLELVSRGSLQTLVAELGRGTLVRRAGTLQSVEPGILHRSFDFGLGPRTCLAVSWGDLATAHYSTGIINLETYFEVTPAIWAIAQANQSLGWLYRLPGMRQILELQARSWGSGPSREQRTARAARIVAEVEEAAGRVLVSRLETPEAYTLTARTATAIARRFLQGDLEPGFQTPSRLFGADFVLSFAGVTRIDMESKN